MKKFKIAIVLSLFLASSISYAAIEIGDNIKISGWIDMLASTTDTDGGERTENFAMEEFEIDFMFDFGDGLTARADIDGGDGRSSFGGDGDEFTVEQAYLRLDTDSGFGITAGKFLSALGFEAYDAINLYQISVSSTLVAGGHVSYPGMMHGVSFDFSNDIFKIYAALLSGVFDNTDTDLEEMGYEAQISLMPVKGLTIKAGYATDSVADSIEAPGYDQSIMNIWASYSVGGVTLAAEYNDLTDQGAEGVDGDGYLVMANVKMTENSSITFRHSAMDLNDGTDESEFTICPSMVWNDHLTLLAEYRVTDVANGSDWDWFAVEALITF